MELVPGTVIAPPGAILWICGKRLWVDDENGWEFVGVFETEEKAVAACLTGMYFVGPTELDKAFPHETVLWKGAYYPKEISSPDDFGNMTVAQKKQFHEERSQAFYENVATSEQRKASDDFKAAVKKHKDALGIG